MPLAINTTNLGFHCSAGFGGVASIEDFWRNTLKWRSKGYAVIIETSGKIWYLNDNTAKYGYIDSYNNGKCFEFITNGVLGNNDDTVSICYIGGVEKNGVDKSGQTIYKGKDTRTPEQKASFEIVINQFLQWCTDNGKNVCSDLGMVGHRDFSKDQNKDGIIAVWERIKECPCFNPIEEYRKYASADRRGLLPTVTTPKPQSIIANKFTIYTVVVGDNLSKIASKNKTTISTIKTNNALTSDVIKVGQKLKI